MATLKVERRLQMNFIAGKIEEFHVLTAQYAKEFAGLTTAEMDTKPAPDRWSMNECLDHLIRSNGTYHAMLQAVAVGTYRPTGWSKVPLLPALWGRMILKSVSPVYAGKNKTFKVWQPSSSTFGRNMCGEFKEANEELARLLQGIAHVDLEWIIVTSPAAKFVAYPLKTCVEILVEHEKRHFNQALQVKREVASRSPEA